MVSTMPTNNFDKVSSSLYPPYTTKSLDLAEMLRELLDEKLNVTVSFIKPQCSLVSKASAEVSHSIVIKRFIKI